MSYKLSSVICNYNHGKLIGRAIDAMSSQSRPPDQLIIVDDGSTDDSVEVIRQHAGPLSYAVIDVLPQNTGAFGALQRALSLVSGDYVYFGAADDYILPGFFEAAMQAVEQHPGVGAAMGCCMMRHGHSGEPLGRMAVGHFQEDVFVSPDRVVHDYFEKESPRHSLCGATIYRRDAIEEFGGFRWEMGSYCDTFLLRAIILKYGFCYLARDCMVWNTFPASWSGATGKSVAATGRIIRNAAALMRSPPFNTLFPQDYVDRWERDYRELSFTDILDEYRRSASRMERQWYSGFQNPSFSEKVVRRFMHHLMLTQTAWGDKALVRHLNRLWNLWPVDESA